MTLNKENYIDLYNREYVVFHANQFDNETRTITLIPKNESELVSLKNYTPRLLYYKPDGRACFYDLSYNEDDSITILLTEQMLSVSGDCLGQLYLTNPSTGEVITSTTFVIKVAKRNGAGEIIESCDDFDALNQMVTRVENVVEKSDTIDEMLTTSEEILEKTQTAYDNAVNAITTAESINSTAEESARLAKESEQNAADSKKEANRHALMSESYFHGGTGVRDEEDEENVLSFYEKIQSIADTNIATEAKAGLVKASDDVHVTTDGTMSIPKLSELENLIKGASSAKVCEDLEDMVTQLNNASLADFTVGTNILIKAVGVPDFWISEVYTENIPYAWTNDEDFINNLHPASSPTENSLQVGYYGISFLETDKVDLTGIAKESYVDQKFTEAQTHSNTNLATAKNYTDNKISGIANTQTPTFLEAETRENIMSGEKLSTIFGKIKKWFSDLKTVAFTGSYNDLTNKPDIPTIPSSLPANGGNADTVDNKHASDFVLKSGKTANRILVTDNNGNVTDGSPIVASELDYLKGIHQNIQNSLTGLENRPNGRMSVYKNDWTTPPGNDGNSNCVMAFIHPDNPYRVDLSSWYKAANGTDTMWCFTVVDRARADVDGNVFSDTYATKSEVSSATIKQELVHIHTGSEGSWSADVNYGSMGYTQIPVAMFLTNRSDNVYNVSYENRDKTLHIVVNRVSGHGGDDYFWIEMIGK